MPSRPTEGYLVELQSVRGIAAVAVVLHHVWYFYGMPREVRALVDVFLNAHAAIVVFFVLSGFVLAKSLMRTGLSRAVVYGFFVRRAFRVYPLLIFATLVCLTYMLSFPHTEIIGASASSAMRFDLASVTVISIALSLTGWPTILPTAYTIVIELIGSAFMPAIARFTKAGWTWSVLMLSAFSVLCLFGGIISPKLFWFSFLLHFALGAVVAFHAQTDRKMHSVHLAVGVAACLLGLIFTRAVWFYAQTGTLQPVDFDYGNPLLSLIEGVFAAGLIWVIASGSDTLKWLRHGIFVRIGDVSYGIYLLHFPLMFVSAQIVQSQGWLGESLPWKIFSLGVLTLTLTLITSSMAYEWIEKPFIALGKRGIRKWPPIST